MNAREQAREAARWVRQRDGEMHNLQTKTDIADAVSDVWEPLLQRINKIQQDWFEGAVPMNVALSEIRQISQEALGYND